MNHDDTRPVNDRTRAVRRDADRGLLRWAFAALLVGAGALLGALGWSVVSVTRGGERTVDRVLDQISQPLPSPTPVLMTQAVVLRALRGASELTTAVYTMETVVDESQERRFGAFPLGRTRLLFIAHGQVRAGVDLDQITAADVTIADEGVTVRLPPPRVLDAKIDVNRSYTYDIQRSLLGPNAPELQSQAERFALERILAGACGDGVLQDANSRAELVVGRLLAATGHTPVTVVTQAPGEGACEVPPSPTTGLTPAP